MDVVRRNRNATNSKKWSRYHGEDIIPMWIADMDFPSPDFLITDLKARAQENYFGYTDIPQEVNRGIVDWYATRYNCELVMDDILFSTSVLHSYRVVLEACLSEKAKIIVFTPVYPPLMKIARKSGFEVIELPLSKNLGRYGIGFKKLQMILKSIIGIEAIVLCNPHNPVGRVWEQAEIKQVKDIVDKNNLYLISDEIHGDLIFKEAIFHSVLEKAERNEKTIVLSSPAKTFNVAGIKASYIITKNEVIREKIKEKMSFYGLNDLDLFAIETLASLYDNQEEAVGWLERIILELEENQRFLVETLEGIERLEITHAEGSYLAWIKVLDSPCRDSDEMRTVLREKYSVDVHEGTLFGGEGKNHIRINFGCPKTILVEGLSRLKQAILEEAI